MQTIKPCLQLEAPAPVVYREQLDRPVCTDEAVLKATSPTSRGS